MAPNTITLRVWSIKEDKAPLKAGVDVTPGMLLAFENVGGVTKVKPHPTAAGVPAPVIVAVEAPWRSGAGIETAFDVDGEEVPYGYFHSGEQFYGLLEAGADVAKDASLESNGAGALQAATTGAKFRALEAKDNSAGYTPVRIRVEVL